MTKYERKFFDFIQKHIIAVFIIIVTLLGILIRACGINFQSGDFQSFLNPWWIQIKSAGIGGLGTQVGNYNIPYQVITFILTLFPFDALVAYKLLSVLFDLVFSGAVALVVFELSGRRSKLLAAMGYALSFCSLTVILNSAFWAQCDSIYVAFIIFALWFTLRDKPVWSFVMLGCALAFKLQTVFIIPVFLFWYVLARKVSILHFLIIPAVDAVLCLPAVFLGRNPMDIITIYLEQTDYGKQIQMNCPNIYAFMCQSTDTYYYELFRSFSILLTVLALGIMLVLMMRRGVDFSDRRIFILTAIWSVFTCIMFLSSMHERYTYLLDILLIIYALVYKKNIIPAVVCNLVSLRGYCSYLFAYEVLDIRWTSLVFIAMYVYITFGFVRDVLPKNDKKKIKV